MRKNSTKVSRNLSTGLDGKSTKSEIFELDCENIFRIVSEDGADILLKKGDYDYEY